MERDNEWFKRKKAFLDRIKHDRDIGYLDEGIEEILDAVNKREKSYTTSSCIGRITVTDTEAPWNGREGNIVFKTHNRIKKEDIEKILRQKPFSKYWMIVSGPILHVMTKDLEEAKYLLEIARKAGFKHSGITSFSEKGYLLEIISSTQIILPLKTGESTIINEETLKQFVDTVNDTLEEGRRRLKRFSEMVSNSVVKTS
jgi:tRNA wybutosine-synthesizing protein 3